MTRQRWRALISFLALALLCVAALEVAARTFWRIEFQLPFRVTSFEHNVAAILDLAAERGDPVMLMTFASYVPANYSRRAFEEARLDYRLHRMPVETWGRREYVLAAVAAHNDVVRRLASDRKNVLFVDQAALMKGSAHYFDDPFHLTIEGSVTFVEHVMSVLRPHLSQG